MCEHDSAALLLELVDGVNIGGEEGPLDRRDDVFHLLVERRHFLCEAGRIFELGHLQRLERARRGLCTRLLQHVTCEGHIDLLSLS